MSLVEKVSKLPKWVIVVIGIAIIAVFGFLFIKYTLGIDIGKKEEAKVTQNAVISVPDAPDTDKQISATEAFSQDVRTEAENVGSSGRTRPSSNVERYWQDLADQSNDPDRLSMKDNGGAGFLDPNVYSEIEIRSIRNGVMTKEEVDRRHEENRREAEERASRERNTAKSMVMTQAQQDSAYFARMERAMQIAAKYTTQGINEAEEEPVKDEEQERKIDLSKIDDEPSSFLGTESYMENPIITSLDEGTGGSSAEGIRKKSFRPVKATFLKTEKVVAGNRVIIRLLQDLPLADGTVIPANTHIAGTCSFKKRLQIHVDMLHYNGRMFPVDISVYDNDGTEGLYCPLAISQKRKERAAKQAATGIASSVGSLAGTVLTGNPFLGSMAMSGLSAINGTINDDGNITVNVSSGYEFYVYENPKEDKEKNNS